LAGGKSFEFFLSFKGDRSLEELVDSVNEY
jgi:hypothetical protein